MTDWIAELDSLEREATQGPWDVLEPSGGHKAHGVMSGLQPITHQDYLNVEDAWLIASLRNHARELIDAAKVIRDINKGASEDTWEDRAIQACDLAAERFMEIERLRSKVRELAEQLARSLHSETIGLILSELK